MFGGSERGVSEVLGVVLLFGLVVASAGVTLYMGSLALGDLNGQLSGENAEYSMRQADSRLGRVAYGQEGGQVVLFSDRRGGVEVHNDSSLTITMNDDPACRESIGMGAIVHDVEGGDTVAYEGGGVWRTTASGTTMVSPPDLQYRNGTINFPMVSISDGVGGRTDSLVVSKDDDDSRARNRAIRETFSKPACFPPANMTVSVTSDYYRGWASFFEGRIAENVTVDDANRTASVRLVRVGETFGADGANLTVSRDFTARVEVLGTELSGSGSNYVFHAPVTMRVMVDGEPRRPWPAGSTTPPAGTPDIRDDLNDPDKPERYRYTLTGEAGTSVSVEATSWNPDGYERADNSTLTIHGRTYAQYRAVGFDAYDRRITIDSTDEGETNLRILRDGAKLDNAGEAGDFQRNLTEIVGRDRIESRGGDAYLDIDDNQALFLYELTQSNAEWDESAGSGDPDYNDAVVLFEVQEAQQAETDFYIHITTSQVTVRGGD